MAASLARDPCSDKLVFFPRTSHLPMADYDGLGDAARHAHGATASVPGAEQLVKDGDPHTTFSTHDIHTEMRNYTCTWTWWTWTCTNTS